MQAAARRRNAGIVAILAATLVPGLALAQVEVPEPYPNFDVRDAGTKAAGETLERHLAKYGPALATKRTAAGDALRRAQESLAARVDGLEVQLSERTGTAEIVGVSRGRAPLAVAGAAGRESALRAFLADNRDLFGLTAGQVSGLRKTADYTNPAGNLSWVRLEREVNGVKVFRGEVTGAFTADGRLARTVGELPGGIDDATVGTVPIVPPAEAVAAAARSVGSTLKATDLVLKQVSADGRTFVYDKGAYADDITVEMLLFPLGYGAVEVAWSTTLTRTDAAYWTIVGGEIADVLWRKNTVEYQTQPATYHVYGSDSPGPLSPSNAIPGSNTQGAGVARTAFTLIGNEAPNTFNDLGWITDGNNTTDGNNVQAGLDRDGTNGVDAAVAGVARVFNFAYNPPPLGADDPLTPAYQNGIVTDLFYWTNVYHDRMYLYGFTEPARNFQNDNFGRGGIGADRISAEAQDSSGTNNANFATPADGGRGRMQMYLFTGPTPDRDGDVDHDVVLHELTHGLSNRLHNNASGLTVNTSRGLGEGWSDFYARALLATADEDVNGVYTTGGYVTLAVTAGFTDNYYYGIRRFPYAVKTTVGGPGNLPHNPMTFADTDPTQISLTDGAYPRGPIGSATATEVHNLGEIWTMMLHEVRARIVTRMGFATGNDRALQVVTDGMKLDPVNPGFVTARNAILAADCAGFAGADEMDIWNGFATRGLGYGAVETASLSGVVESYALANLGLGTVTYSDSACNANGYPDPSENLTLSVPLVNYFCATPANSATATIAGNVGTYGTIAGGATSSQSIPFFVPPATPCGSTLAIPIQVNSSLGPVNFTFNLPIGMPVVGFTENFDGVVAPALPAGWSSTATGSQVPWVTSTTTPAAGTNAAFSTETATTGTNEFLSPSIPVTSASARLSFKNMYNSESGWDGMLLQIQIGAGTFTDIITAGGSWVSGGYNRTMNTGTGVPLPLRGAPAWSGLSGGTTAAPTYVDSVVNLPASANGQSVVFKWVVANDNSVVATGAAGYRVDSISITTGTTCAPTTCTPVELTGFDAE